MRKWLAILVTLVACKDHDVESLDAIKQAVCACKSASCADQAMNRVPKTAMKSTPRTQALAREIMECRAKLEEAERPTTDPDAEGRAAEPGSGSAAAAPAPNTAPATAP